MSVDPLEQELDVQDHQVSILQVEKMLEEKLPNSGLKASPHIESRVKTLKKQFNAIMDMLTHGSGFSWDNEKKMVLCDQDVFEGANYFLFILQGHKDANGLRLKPFPHFDDLSLVFGKDRANGKGAMSAADILEELDQVEASNVEWNVHHNLVGKEQGMMTQL
ncbi:hypothetical protein AAG906_013099 [Vitis piasezkii]